MTEVVYGSVAVAHGVARRIHLSEIVDRHAPKRNGIPTGKLVEILAINRLLDPKAKHEIPDWIQTTALPELIDVNLPVESGYQTLTRCYDYLTDEVQMQIEMDLAEQVRKVYSVSDSTFLYDITSTFTVGEGSNELFQYGYSRDHRPDCKQVNFGLVVSREEAVPMFHRIFPGNVNDCKTVKSTMGLFNDHMGMNGCLVVDRGMVSTANVIDIVDNRRMDLVAGMRMTEKLKRTIRQIKSFDVQFQTTNESIQAKEFQYIVGKKPRRCILYFSEQKAERDYKARMKNVRLVEKEMIEISKKCEKPKGRGRNPDPKKTIKKIDKLVASKNVKGFFHYRFVGGRGGRRFKWSIDDKALERAKEIDGKFVLITTLDDTSEEILKIYRSRSVIERAFRITKEKIKIRPIWSRNEQHIKAHLFICFLAYLLMSLIELKLKRAGEKVSGQKALKHMSYKTMKVERKLDIDDGSRELRIFKKETTE